MKKILLLLALFSGTTLLQGQTYTGGSGAINDYATSDFPLTVSGLVPSTIDSINFGLETVCINLTHTWDADLDIKIIAPDGTSALLTSGQGGGNDDYTNTCFNQYAGASIITGNPPYTGTFIPMGQMGRVNNNQSGNGTWILRVIDTYPADAGNMISWSITFGNNPATCTPFTDSNLPIMVINTGNSSIVDNPKIMADMGIIYNGVGVRNYMTDPWNHYNGKIGIEIRGSSSQMFPKKTYGFETWDVNGFAIDSALLGMPKESDWILSASYSDKSMMNNPLSYALSRELGWYAPRTKYVELVINGEYVGVYSLMEKIKRDNNRVNIKRMDPTFIAGDSLTGGYIIKIDKPTGSGGGGWTSPYAPAQSGSGQTIYFRYEYPSDVNIVPQQQAYLQAYVDSFETALSGPNFADTSVGYPRYMNVNSFIDYFLINEMSRNVDGYRLSTYLYKNRYSKKQGKLVIGPTWDYDIAWGNADYCSGSDTTGWAYQFGNVCPGDGWQIPFWWERLMQDTNFTNKLRCRWEEVSQTALSVNYMHYWADSVNTLLTESAARNFATWPILGSYVWPNPFPYPNSYQGEVDELKNWMSARWTWMDNNMPGNLNGCNPTSVSSSPLASKLPPAYPNPFSSQINLSIYQKAPISITMELVNALGQTVQPIQTAQHNGGTETIVFTPATDLPAGIYLLRITAGSNVWTQQLSKAD